MIEFKEWPKTPRLFRDMIVTEKIDGTNAAIIIEPQEVVQYEPGIRMANGITASTIDGNFVVGAQSRRRLIDPEDDNFGFARWVHENADDLLHLLGPGRHYGEWWGSGIQRGYGLKNGEKRFSLFNVKRYATIEDEAQIDGSTARRIGLDVVPTLYSGPFSLLDVKTTLVNLRITGSYAAPGFMRPEGVVVFHEASGQVFKSTLENDGLAKGRVAA